MGDRAGQAEIRMLAAGDGWRASDIRCAAGPADAPFEEAHDRVAVVAVLAGRFAYRSSHGRVLMTPGSLLLGNSGACFCCSHEHGRGDRCIAFHFDPAVLDGVASGLRGAGRAPAGFRRHRLPPADALLPLLATVRAAAARPDPLLLEETGHRLVAAALQVSEDVTEPPVGMAEEGRVAAAAALIESRYMEPLTLAMLADVAGVSRYHFVRLFRRVIGVTPYAYVLNRRLAAAADALRRGEATVLDVALASGFGDLSEFTRRFHARFGRPPAAYREARP